ncbi:MAG: LamG domain-containing protein, partial [Methylococcales bacterium]|nr:LamG domain-containing protein [Methylococcales bacterium]
FKLEVNIVGEEQTIEVIRSQLPKKPEVFISVKWDLTSWTHVALTFDTNVIKLYINGNLVQSSGPVPAGPVIVNSTIALCLPFSYNQNGGWPGSLQSMSIWNRLIGADELEKCTRWIEPDTPGLQAFFPLLTHATDTVKGLNLDLTNGAIANDEEIVAGGTTAYRKPQEQSDVLSQDVAEGTLLQPKDYWSLAAKHGINIETRNIKDCLEDEDLAELYGSSYFSVAEPARSRMITEFDRSFRLGKELCQQDIKTGKIEARFENGSTVFYYHTVKGPEEIYREDLNLTPLEIWIITIIADVLFVVLSVVGLSTTPGVVKSATSRGARLSRLVPQISASLQNIGPGPSGIVAFAGNVVNILNDAGTLFSIFWNIVTASWWSIIFVCVSLIASVLAIVLFPASAGWRFFNVG